MNTADFSSVAVTFQGIGILLLALTMAQLGRTFAWRYARQWALAWSAMFVALLSVRLYIATITMPLTKLWWGVYLAGEWAFLLLLYAGCRELTDRVPFRVRRFTPLLPAVVIIGAILILLSHEFNDLFIIQAAIIAFGAAASFRTLGRVGTHRRTIGWQSMRLSLALLAILYLAYVPLYAMLGRGFALSFLSYSSLADLLAAVLVGFSMVLMATEEASVELREAVDALQAARDQLEDQLNHDPLTTALSRHAFRAIKAGSAGVVIMIDVDHLKWINDHDGHMVGDAVIRASANAVRARIRADDLLFRWGGDEFLAIMPGSSLSMVRERLAPLATGITVRLPMSDQEKTFYLSWGGAEFSRDRSLEEAIAIADAEMYERRMRVRRAGA